MDETQYPFSDWEESAAAALFYKQQILDNVRFTHTYGHKAQVILGRAKPTLTGWTAAVIIPVEGIRDPDGVEVRVSPGGHPYVILLETPDAGPGRFGYNLETALRILLAMSADQVHQGLPLGFVKEGHI